jgi:hypothetical protein
MPAVVPTQIVQFIDTTLHYFNQPSSQGIQLSPSTCGALNALLRLIEQLPNSLLPSDPDTYAQFILSQESIRFAVKKAQRQDSLGESRLGTPCLRPDGGGKPFQVQIIRAALAACPDEVPPRHSKELLFINPADLRETLLIDLEATRSALSHGEWKAATVLAGSLVEALLLWAIQQKPDADIRTACSAAVSAGRLQKNRPADPLNWGLSEFAEVAAQLALIEPDAAMQTRLAKDFRNLIHPGRELRTQRSCGRGTALAANAAVELVSRDLQARFP